MIAQYLLFTHYQTLGLRKGFIYVFLLLHIHISEREMMTLDLLWSWYNWDKAVRCLAWSHQLRTQCWDLNQVRLLLFRVCGLNHFTGHAHCILLRQGVHWWQKEAGWPRTLRGENRVCVWGNKNDLRNILKVRETERKHQIAKNNRFSLSKPWKYFPCIWDWVVTVSIQY